MSLLGGLGHWLRNEADNIGSVITGQPAHGPAPTPQPQAPPPQAPRVSPQQQPGSFFSSNPSSQSPGLPLYHPTPPPQSKPPQGVPQPHLGVNQPNPLVKPPTLPFQQQVQHINSQPQTSFDKTISNFARPIGEAASGLAKGIAQPIEAIPKTVYSVGRTIPANISGNQVAIQNANKAANNVANQDIEMGKGFLQFVPRAAVSAGSTIVAPFTNHPTETVVTPHGGFQKALLGNQPVQSLENVYKTAAQHGGGASGAGNVIAQGAQDLLGLAAGTAALHKATPAIIDHAKQLAADQSGHIGFKNATENHPAVQALRQHQQLLQQADDNMAQRGLAPKNPARINNAKAMKSVVQAIDDTKKQISQGGYAKIPSTEPTPEPSKGFIIKETKPRAGRQDVIRLKKNPDTGKLQQSVESIEAPSAIKQYAASFGISRMQAEKDFAKMHGESIDRKSLTPEELAQLGPEEKLSIKDKRALIQKDPRQHTVNQPGINPEVGSAKSAIAEAMAVAQERDARLADAQRLGNKLSNKDKALLYRYDAGEKIDKLAREADNPKAFTEAANTAADALDYSLAASRTGGASTLKQHNYIPHNYEVSEEWLNKHKIPEDQRIKIGDQVKGFRDIKAKYPSYAAADKTAGLKPLFANPFEDIADYAKGGAIKTRNELLAASLAKSHPEDIAPIDTTFMGGKHFKPAAGGELPFAVSEDLDKQLKGFRKAWSPDTKAGQVVEGSIKLAGKGTKKLLFMGSLFHQAHISENVAFASALGREPRAFTDGLLNEAKAKGGLTKGSYYRVVDHYREDGTLDFARRMGLSVPDHSALDRFINSYAFSLAKAAKEGGIEAGSKEAVDLGTIYNRLLGRDNPYVEARNPTIEKFTSYFALAPHYLRTQLKLVHDALLPKKLGGAGYDKPTSLLTPGGAARSAVIGPRVLGAMLTITASAIIMHHFPTWQDAVNEAGLNPNNVNPNIKIKSKNAKGEGQVMNIPTDPIGLALGFVTDPQHFFQSRYSPVVSFGTKVATNKNWNGQNLVDSNSPNQIPLRVARAAENAFLPIGVQNYTNLQHNQNNPNVVQGTAQEFGLRLKTDPNDPQVQANKNYFNTFDKVSNEIKNSGPNGQYWAQQFNGLHPKNTTDSSGTKYPSPYAPLHSEQKYAAYVDSSSGTAKLSPVFAADKKLAQTTPGYPVSPLYKLSGTGTDAEGNKNADRALVALEYQHAQLPQQKQNIMNANGGKDGWLAQYEQKLGDYSKNYQANLTNYFKGLGWSDTAINNYWQKHPSSPDPIDNVNFDKPTQSLLDQYFALSATGDGTQAKDFFTQHSDVLGNAMDQLAEHANAIRQAKGELQLQGYPPESAHVKQVMSSWPTGSDPDSKRIRAQSIQANPDVNQYLADISLYEVTSKGTQFIFKNPADMKATEGENINNSGATGQTFLKDAISLGKYDIAKNPDGTYSFMQNGGFQAGATTGGGYGSKKRVKAPFIRRQKRIKVRGNRHHKAHIYLKKPPSPIKIKNKANDHIGIKSKTFI